MEPTEDLPDGRFPHLIAELPAGAVTRAVTVARRGIVSGVRATGAAFRAAF
jgi:hypothetical protein